MAHDLGNTDNNVIRWRLYRRLIESGADWKETYAKVLHPNTRVAFTDILSMLRGTP